MPYRTIVVHFQNESGAAELAASAAKLAKQQEAHLVGLFITPKLDVYYSPVGVFLSPDVIKSSETYLSREAEKISEIFKRETDEAGLSAEWQYEEAEADKVLQTLVDIGRAADLIIVSQPEPNAPKSSWSIGDLLLSAGRPILVQPHGYASRHGPARVVVAWNGTAEAARAVFDAMPLIGLAEKAVLLSVGQSGVESEAQRKSQDAVAATLERHGISVEIERTQAPASNVGETLIQHLNAIEGDLLVMGGFGHSRISELVLGGTTRHVLSEMKHPVLMSH